MQRSRIGLVGCVKSKRDVPAPAADLYVSTLFGFRRGWVEAACSRWYILSAKHGLVTPEEVLEPYDESLTTRGSQVRRAWAGRVLTQLEEQLGDLGPYEFEIHAGAAYTSYGLSAGLASAGAEVVLPVAGLSLGRQLAFYRRTAPAGEVSTT